MAEETNGYYPVPQPDELTTKEKDDATGGYLMMFAALGAGLPLPIINLIASIIYYYTNKSNSRFVQFHTYQALLSQIPLTLLNAVCMGWGLRIFLSEEWHFTSVFAGYLSMLIVANLTYIVFGIISAVKASKGRMYYYWIFGRIAYEKIFAIRPETNQEQMMNQPPRL
jgi:uncharacterized Tic20 family protein